MEKLLIAILFIFYLFTLFISVVAGSMILKAIKMADTYMWKDGLWLKGWDPHIIGMVIKESIWTLVFVALASTFFILLKDIRKDYHESRNFVNSTNVGD